MNRNRKGRRDRRGREEKDREENGRKEWKVVYINNP